MIAPSDGRHEKMQEAALRAERRADAARQEREPSFAARLGQIGVLGWAIVAPILLGVVIGRWLDRAFGDRKSTRLNSSHQSSSRMPSSA